MFRFPAIKIKEQFLSSEFPHRSHTNKFFIFLFLFSVILYSAVIFRVKTIVWGDSLYYYAYTRSVVVDHDIDFTNEAYRDNGGFPNEPEISEITGKITNKFSPGSSILWIPGFMLGFLLNGQDGYGFLTQYIVAISTIVFSVLGLFFIYKMVSLFFEKNIAFLTTLFFYLTTQMFYYTSLDPLNSHSASFMLSSLFLYLVVVFSQRNKNSIGDIKFGGEVFSWQKMIILGLLGGMIALVRNQDVVVLLPVSIYFLVTKSDGLMERLNRLVLFWGSVFLVVSIQLFATLSLYGQLGSPYLLGGEQLSWFKPDFIRVLFSFENGLITFAPVLLLAILGLFWSQKISIKGKLKVKNSKLYKNIGLISIFAFLFQLYVVASWGREIIGGPYGSRMFISVLPHLSIGLALVLQRYKNHPKFFLYISTGITLLFINNLLQTAIMLVRF